MEGKYRRLQKAHLISLSAPFDTCVITSGYKADIHASIRSRKVDLLAAQLRREGKVVQVHQSSYTPNREDGWEVET